MFIRQDIAELTVVGSLKQSWRTLEFWTGSGRLERPQFIQLGPKAKASKGWRQIGHEAG